APRTRSPRGSQRQRRPRGAPQRGTAPRRGLERPLDGTVPELYPQLLPVADQVGVLVIVVGCYGSMRFPAGLLASCLRRWEEAERHFEGALATNERLEARPWVVRTRRGWAAILLDRDAPGDRERAAELIAAGRAEAETLGMARELVRFDRLLERLESGEVS